MYSLIITIVSIALVVALIGATMYYGGDTLSQGRAKSEAAAYVSGGQQIVGALQMYNALENEAAADLDALTDGKYLSSLPAVGDMTNGWTITALTSLLTKEGVPADVCESINKQVGLTGAQSALGTTNYACIGVAGAAGTLTMGY